VKRDLTFQAFRKDKAEVQTSVDFHLIDGDERHYVDGNGNQYNTGEAEATISAVKFVGQKRDFTFLGWSKDNG
jgi:hypothetical protein